MKMWPPHLCLIGQGYHWNSCLQELNYVLLMYIICNEALAHFFSPQSLLSDFVLFETKYG